MKIVECLWKEQFVEKLERKHQVLPMKSKRCFAGAPRFDFVTKGHIVGENVYRALGQTDAGRYLAVFFIYKRGGKALPISARDMDTKERRRYGKK